MSISYRLQSQSLETSKLIDEKNILMIQSTQRFKSKRPQTSIDVPRSESLPHMVNPKLALKINRFQTSPTNACHEDLANIIPFDRSISSLLSDRIFSSRFMLTSISKSMLPEESKNEKQIYIQRAETQAPVKSSKGDDLNCWLDINRIPKVAKKNSFEHDELERFATKSTTCKTISMRVPETNLKTGKHRNTVYNVFEAEDESKNNE